MDPYEKTGAELKRQAEGPKRFLKTAGTLAASAAGGAGFAPMLSRAAPFLSKYIPQSLAIAGLSKVNPNFGKYIKDGLDNGFSFEQLKEFMGKQINESQEGKAKQDKNIIEQESPELHSFIDQEIRKGRKPIEAAALAQNDKRFSSIIKKLMKTHKTPWSSIIESIFGSGEMGLQNQQQPGQQEQLNQSGFPNQQQGQPQQGGQQGGGKWDQIRNVLQDTMNL